MKWFSKSHYNKILAKSNRLQWIFGQGGGDPSETICDSHFFDDYPIRHIFTHYIQLRDIDESIQKLDLTKKLIESKLGQQITHSELKAINDKVITYTNRDLARTNFAKVVVNSVNQYDEAAS
jgi:hypothetical protein